jgi:hypothetical protein
LVSNCNIIEAVESKKSNAWKYVVGTVLVIVLVAVFMGTGQKEGAAGPIADTGDDLVAAVKANGGSTELGGPMKLFDEFGKYILSCIYLSNTCFHTNERQILSGRNTEFLTLS